MTVVTVVSSTANVTEVVVVDVAVVVEVMADTVRVVVVMVDIGALDDVATITSVCMLHVPTATDPSQVMLPE